MITAKVVRNFADYVVYQEDQLIIKARDVSTLLNPGRIIFFDNMNQALARSKERFFLGLSISLRLYLTDGQIIRIKQKQRTDSFVINNVDYEIKRTTPVTHDLLKNKSLVGHLKKEKESVSTYENSIICDTFDDCFTFSMISILLYSFDVN